MTIDKNHPCYKSNRICLNSHKNFTNISDDGIVVDGNTVMKHGYVNTTEIPNFKGDVQIFYIDLEKDIQPAVNIKIHIKR